MIAWLTFVDQLNIAAGWCLKGKPINLVLMEARIKSTLRQNAAFGI